MKEEEQHLQECRALISRNLVRLEEEFAAVSKEAEELYRAVRGGDTELYAQLMVSENLKEHYESSLRKNRQSYEKPYFGRIDYEELETGKEEALYIGKNGITLEDHQVIVVDWRAPVSTVYYENALGRGSYRVPELPPVQIDLTLKRTFDIAEGKLAGYYDSDVAANDELLVKYLSQNKEAVLGDIISTIQKEQNEIIRETPYANILVQGVAGSGKTTVAMHRISYILYNYGERFAPEEFCIIAGSDMLLRYITSGLPELDVSNVGQMRMDRFLIRILKGEWKKNYRYIPAEPDQRQKSKREFVCALERYLDEIRESVLPDADVEDPVAGVFLSGEDIRDTLARNRDRSVAWLTSYLNERLRARIRMLLSEEDERKLKQEKVREYKNWFVWKKNVRAAAVYAEFLLRYAAGLGDETCLDKTVAQVQKGRFDVYDLAAMALIYVRLMAKEEQEDYSQIIIDEAQDFGVAVYEVLRRVLPGCYFTIMGDVSQNIHFELGMNRWDELKEYVFGDDRSRFHILAKSYRNTIEISEFAGNVLREASAGAYKIQPVIRHGKPVGLHQLAGSDEAVQESSRAVARKTEELLLELRQEGYDTIAVICREEQEAEEAAALLHIPREEAERENFQKGVMVLPVAQTKGLEFDAAILWNPGLEQYQKSEGDAKLLYVAVTRALHELHIVCCGPVSELLEFPGQAE